MYMMFFWLLRSLSQPYFVFFFSIFSARLLLNSCRQTTKPQPNTGSIVSKILAAKKPVSDSVHQCNLGRDCFNPVGDVLFPRQLVRPKCRKECVTLSWSCAICIFISTPGSNPCSYHHQLTLLAFKISLFDEAKRRNSVDLHLQVPPDLNHSDALQFRLHEETMDFHQQLFFCGIP